MEGVRMSIIGLIEFLGGALILCGVTCFAYQWFKQNLPSRDIDDPCEKLWYAFVSAMIGICTLMLSVLVLMLFLSMVFPATVW